jgi:hydrogenase maturation protease
MNENKLKDDKLLISQPRCHQVTLSPRRILIAGVGNIFFGDDAFGVEVVRRLAERTLPAGVVVKDFGIRGFDLACALQEGYQSAILIDAVGRSGVPGTLYVLELHADGDTPANHWEMHHLDPMQVFRLVQQMGGVLPQMFLVGCEPATLEPAEEGMPSLSEPVQLAVWKAIEMIETLVAKLQASEMKVGRSCDA